MSAASRGLFKGFTRRYDANVGKATAFLLHVVENSGSEEVVMACSAC